MKMPKEGTNKRIAVNSAVLYLRVILTLFITLFSTRYVLKGLGEDDFGIYNLVAGIVALFSFISGALSSTTQRFISYELGATHNTEHVKNVFNTSVRLHILIALGVTIIIITGGLLLIQYILNIPVGSLNAARIVLICVGIGLIGTILSVPYEAALMAHENIIFVAGAQLLNVFLRFGIALLILIIDNSRLITYAVFMAVIPYIILFLEFGYTLRRYPETHFKKIKLKHNPILSQMKNFAGYTLWGNMGWVFRTQGISIILNMFWGVALNAANGIANQVNGALLNFSSTLTTSLRPQLIQSAGERNNSRMMSLATSACKYPMILILLIGAPLFICMPYILKLWLSDVPEYTVVFCRFLIIDLLINQSTFGLALILDAKGKIKALHLSVGLSLILTTLCAYFVGKHVSSPVIIYWCIIVNDIIIGILRFFLVMRCLKNEKIHFPVGKIIINCFIRPYFASVILFAINFYLWHYLSGPFGSFILFGFISSIICIATSFVLILDNNEKQKIYQTAKRLIKLS